MTRLTSPAYKQFSWAPQKQKHKIRLGRERNCELFIYVMSTSKNRNREIFSVPLFGAILISLLINDTEERVVFAMQKSVVPHCFKSRSSQYMLLEFANKWHLHCTKHSYQWERFLTVTGSTSVIKQSQKCISLTIINGQELVKQCNAITL